jgi:2-polyprenyl-3-methyl-5-hydroxy-6-metoxy-1,4-benzoquinol methylase
VSGLNAQHAAAVARKRAGAQFQEFLNDCRASRQQVCGKRILELGFGNGLFLQQCREAGMAVTGLEVREPVYLKTRQAFPEMDLRLYDGSAIPAEANSFDYIVSFQVLEHVCQLEPLFDECVRVLKPGGIMYHRLPNYRSFYEGHYKVLWLPFLNKRTGRAYLKMLGKYTDYYESLNIIKPADVRRLCSDRPGQLELISDGREQFAGYFEDAAHLGKIRNKFVRAVARGVCRIRPLRNVCCRLLLKCDMYYPMLLLARKKSG